MTFEQFGPDFHEIVPVAIRPALMPMDETMRLVLGSGYRGRRLPSLAALIFMVGALLVFSLSTWNLFKYFEQSKEEDLQSRLLAVARTIGYQMQVVVPIPLYMVQKSAPDTEVQVLQRTYGMSQYQAFVNRLAKLKEVNHLAQIVVMTARGFVVADSNDETLPGEQYVFWQKDYQQIERALSGVTQALPFTVCAEIPYKRVYHAIIRPADNGNEMELLGIIQVSASPDYFDRLEGLRRKVGLQWLVSAILLILIGFSISRLFTHMVRVRETRRCRAHGSRQWELWPVELPMNCAILSRLSASSLKKLAAINLRIP